MKLGNHNVVKLDTKEFQELLQTVQNPYGDGCASEKILEVLKTVQLDDILKKSFYNLQGEK